MTDPIVLGDNEEIEIYGDRLTVPEKTRSRILIRNVVKVPPPVEPPPDPGDGEVVFEDGFENWPGEWTQTPAAPLMWEWGNTNTNPRSDVPDELGLHSLRAKMGNCVKPAGCFAPGASATISRNIQLKAGKYRAELWRVAHDVGYYSFVVNDHTASGQAFWWAGTDGLVEYEWRLTPHLFEVAQAGTVELAFEYTAPSDPQAQTGVKCALIRIRKVV